MPQQQRIRTRTLILLTGLLMGGAAFLCPAQGQSLQQKLPSSMTAAHLAPAEPYSYVFLDPLEGNHHATKADDGSHQGFQMHGHWIIDVKNPDGTTAQHRDFENTITNSGGSYLVGMMAGYFVPSDYAIGLSIGTSLAPCALSAQGGCMIVRSLTTNPGYGLCAVFTCATGLTYSTSNIFGNTAASITLTGSLTATKAGNIYDVETYAGICPNSTSSLTTVSPATCNATPGSGNTTYLPLSGAVITPISVVASQIVQVTVTISFS